MMTAKVPQSGTWLPWLTTCILVFASLLPQLHGQPTNETNSNWNSWTDGVCSRTCGGGVMKSTRTCEDRSNKGCLGNKVKYTSCNTQDCPDDTDFRSLQCADFNQKPMKDVYYKWVPYLGDDADRCALVCSAVNGTLRETMKGKVVDGTPCNAHGTEVCVDGTCKSVGCDRVLGSSKAEDACRICGGEGKHCKTVKKSVETTKLKNGYNDFLVIPRGATNILVKNRKDSENHFALRTNRGKFLLNGKWKLVNYSKFHRYGTTFYYINDGKTQQLSAVGPISTNLILVLVVKEKTADIEYEYSIQKEGETSTVLLRHLEPAPPLKQLSSTLKQSNDSQSVYISSEMGASRIRLRHRKPELAVNPPRDQEPLMQLTAKEAARGSADGVDDDGSDDDNIDGDFPVNADDDDDDDDHKVTNRKFAFVPIDPNLTVTDDVQGLRQYEWNVGGWTECSVSCGAGVQRRVVMCYDVYKRKNVPERCDRASRPASTKSCRVSCNIKIRWVETGWTECSETCDGGQMSSIMKCMEMSGSSERQVGDNLCIEREGAARRLTKKCNEQPCERNPRPEVSCWETLYGCCPDRRTAAQGPGHAGCSTPTSCVDSSYGCCPDRVSYARGPNYAGCPGCQNTDYGCCPDGVTTAEGPNYAGCSAGTTAADHCSLEHDRGSCSDYTQKWGYDPETRRCKQFWYGGCGGNENRFDSDGDCLRACRDHSRRTHPHTRPTPSRPRPPVTGANVHCSAEPARGTCSDYTQKWAYDTETRRCKQFWYGGCGGNTNRFDDERACLEACRNYRTPTVTDPRTRRPTPTRPEVTRPRVIAENVHCSAEPARGTCSDYTQKWAYDTETRRCKQFWYGGCGGNTNRFDDERACLEACRNYRTPTVTTPRTRRPTPISTPAPVTPGIVHCSAEPARGTCSDYTQKWAYDTETRRCKQFWYGGCGGNTNRFDDERACLKACRNYRTPTVTDPRTRRPTPTRPEVTRPRVIAENAHCSLEHDRGSCSDYTQKWGYDPETRRCKQFWYGGCGGNENRFDSDGDCLRACRDHRGQVSPRPTTRRRGCADTSYGCCDDRRTPARGPNKEGCPERTCAASSYGCCPDGVTFARGPDYEGCRLIGGCAGTRYGCCADGVTAARGQDSLGCPERQTCRGSRYGCCRDGVRAAHGPNYYGCEPHPVAEGDCISDKDSGTCSDHTIKWFYDRASSTCQQFWYGGCGGNGNRYDTEEDCRRKCHHRVESHVAATTPTAADDVCKLPKAVGNCRARQLRWYFDHETVSCQKFYYTGCHGNDNNFNSEQQCVHRCFAPNPIIQFTIPPNEKELSRDPLVVCHLGVDAGACDDQFVMWYYDAQEGECKQFNYTGCYGNSNRYKTKQSCEALCNRDTVCNFTEDYGQCNSKLRRFRYDSAQKDCIPFRYSGCNGNANNFYSAEACRKKCGVIPEVPTTAISPDDPTGICQLKQDSGTCYAYSKQWFFNMGSKQCEEFAYGGCGGNANRFATLETCQKACQPFLAKPTVPTKKEKPTDICSLLENPVICDAIGPSWYYNMTSGTCQKAPPGYCLSNRNSFKTKDACNYLCDPKILCQMPAEPGLCYAYMPHYSYNKDTKMCERFVYGGCGGNANRFPSMDTCMAVCKPREKKLPLTPTDICSLPKETGICYAYSDQYYFNMVTRKCEEFVYGGCGGNPNRFPSLQDCQKFCSLFIVKPSSTTTITTTVLSSPAPADICFQPKEAGICLAHLKQYYFNMVTRQCEDFVYGGCGGNTNRFHSLQECKQFCSPFIIKVPLTTTPSPSVPPIDVCLLPKKKGHCYAYIEQYFHNTLKGKCEMFVYGGCGGNANRFATFEECRLRCGSSIEWTTPYIPFTTPATTMTTTELRVVSTRYCHLKEEVGSCTDIMYKWYYNMGEGRCKKFLYSGCGGNNNRYESKEECEKICQPKDMCSLPKETGICYSYSEQYYFNMVTRQCEQFVYGGCGGNANRFASIYKCEQLCSAFVVKPMTTIPYTTWTPTMPKNVCQLPKEPGNCYSYSEQYFFNNKLGRCERFVYGGCGGNANRFTTFLECRNKCEPKTTPPIFTFITSRTPKPVPTVNQTKPTPKPEVCHLQKIVGPCSSRITAWYHDSLQGVCSQFKYSGCGGNQNNFKTREECERACKPMKDLCDLPRNTGRCHNVTRRWHFSKKDNKCIRFAFTGCGGNANNFETEDECRKACKAPGESAKDVCHFAKKIGSCKGAIPSWYYDMSVGQCMKFLYGGCEGNKNRFRMKHECEATCNKKDICRLPEDSGICYAYSTAYFYDSNMKKCRKFVYGGCGGNANRFPTMGACYNLCGPNATTPRNHTGPVIPGPISVKQPMKCKLPATTGSCQDIRRMWYYDHVKEQCDQFFYSGCGGNGNRFHTELECLASCRVKSGPEMRPPTVFTLPPFLTVTPTNNIIKLGVDLKKKVVLQCGEAVGYSVTWSHNGKDIFPDNRHDIRGWELVIHDVDYKDVGLYTCRRNDDITDTPLERYQLNIKDSLQLIIDKSPARFHEGDTIKLKCHTNGYPYTELKWYHRSYPVRSQGRITANEGSLMINRATFSDSGIYTCKGKYQNEQVGKDVRVHVLPKPNEVSDECLNVQDVLPTLQCRIIVTSQLCDQRAFRTQCCASCKKHRNVIS